MIVEIGNIIKDKLEPLRIGGVGANPFINRLAGVVKMVTKSEQAATGGIIKQTFPVSCNTSFEECAQNGAYKDLMPNSSVGCIVYLEEDGALTRTDKNSQYEIWNTSFILVGWLNQNKLGTNACSITGKVVQTILKQLNIMPFNSGIYNAIEIDVVSQDPKSFDPFARYTYDEDNTQYKFAPFDYFSLRINVVVRINTTCAEAFEIDDPITCN